jgi:glycosyltransferase involved in cell wall biosynthesis
MPEVVHVSPLQFGEAGLFGGGERYALELARAMSRHVSTRLVSFGSAPRRFQDGHLDIDVLPLRGRYAGHEVNPLSERLPLRLASARVIHAHHYQSLLTNFCLVYGRAFFKPVFVTDHGGHGRNYARQLRLHRAMKGFLPVSRFAGNFYPLLSAREHVVYGGVDTERFSPSADARDGVVFVGRMLYFKGVDVLIEALSPTTSLRLVGPTYDAAYLAVLCHLAVGKDVTFVPPLDGDDVVDEYRRARVAVMPSIITSEYGPTAPGELFPLALLEAMACGTPVVASDVGGIPEMVTDGVNGFVVPAGDVGALRERIDQLLGDDALWRRMSLAARESVLERFTWARVAERCLEAYDRR